MLSKILFELIRNEIFGREITVENKEFSAEFLRKLYRLSKSHDVAHLISDALIRNGLIPQDGQAIKQFVKQQQISVSRYERINYELQRLIELFDKENIPFITLKGAVLRDYYPQPWMRTSCDIDILVKEEDLDRATDVLINKYKYRKTLDWDHDISFMSESDVHLELHYNFVEYVKWNPEMLKLVWDTARKVDGYNCRYEMPTEVYYYYHVAHMAKHFESGGCGLRPFLDLAIMTEKIPVAKEKLTKLLAQSNLEKFYEGCVKLCGVWFDDDEHDKLSKSMELFILSAGVYGNIENKVAVMKSTKSQGKFKYLMFKIFLPYEYLSVIYPKLKNRRYLTPFYEIRRWFEILFCGRMKNAVREIKVNANTGSEQVQKATELIRDLGLNEKTEQEKVKE